jgi:hypothetical protein
MASNLLKRIIIRTLLFIDQTLLHDRWLWLCSMTCLLLNRWQFDLDGKPYSESEMVSIN